MKFSDYVGSLPHGGKKKLAEDLGIRPGYLSGLISGKLTITVTRAMDIERATKGVVTRKDLRPDDWFIQWPELAEREPAAVLETTTIWK